MLAALLSSVALAWWGNRQIVAYFGDKRWETVTQLLISAGGALIGATAIAFSIITFAMQVNVERMPHALFNRMSADWRLLGYAITSFGSACGVALLSLVPDATWAPVVLVVGSWLAFAVFALYVLAYRRAIALVSPIQQLSRVVGRIHKALRRWKRLADAATKAMGDLGDQGSGVDQGRLLFLRANDAWTQEVKQGIQHAIAYSRRYGEQGDYEVAAQALDALVVINALYVQAKGRTFFSHTWMVENPFVDDGVITETLENLRKRSKSSLSASDERQMELHLQGFLKLYKVYEHIEYQKHSTSKTHAALATHYLAGAVTDIVRQGFPDVVMDGVRLLGRIGVAAADSDSHQVSTVTETLALVGCLTAARNELVVSTIVAGQLAEVEFAVLTSSQADIGFSLDRCRTAIFTLTQVVLGTPDPKLGSGHGAWLAPYFGSTSQSSLAGRLVHLANALNGVEDKARRAQICDHVTDWAKDQPDFVRKLFEICMANDSSLLFDLLHWIETNCQVMLVVAGFADDHDRPELEKHALWLASVLSWAATDKSSVQRLEANGFGDVCFRIAYAASDSKAWEICERLQSIVIRWSLDGGQEANGWGTLERGMLVATAIQIACELGDRSALARKVEQQRNKTAKLNPNQMFRAADDLREEAERYRSGYSHNDFEGALAAADQDTVREALLAVADVLDPTNWLPLASSAPRAAQ